MSEYFRALKQIERDQIADRQPPSGPPAPSSPAAGTVDKCEDVPFNGAHGMLGELPNEPLPIWPGSPSLPRRGLGGGRSAASQPPAVPLGKGDGSLAQPTRPRSSESQHERSQRPSNNGGHHSKPESQRLVLPGDSSPTPDTPLPAYGALFDNLRVLANGQAIRVLVFAGASAGDPTRAVTAGIATHAAHLGLRVFTAALSEVNGRAVLRPLTGVDSSLPGSAGDPLSLDLSRPGWEAAFADWLRPAAAEADLVIIEGRPLGQSIDAAQLARACDGLVIVAQPEVTPRQALQAAAERARTVGCRTLGVVMHGTKNHLPDWLRSIAE